MAAVLVALAGLLALRGLQPPEQLTVPVVVTAAALPAGHIITPADVRVARWPVGFGTGSAFQKLQPAIGRMTAGAMSAGEVVAPSRVLGPGLLALSRTTDLSRNSGPPGTGGATGGPAQPLVAAPVRLADAGETALLKPGDFVDVLAARSIGIGEHGTSEQQSSTAVEATVIARAAQVIVVPSKSDSDGTDFLANSAGDGDGRTSSLIVVAVDSSTASALAGAATRSRLSVVLRPEPNSSAS